MGHADASRAKKIIADEFHGRFQPKDTRFLRQAKGPAAWNSFRQQNKGLSRVEMLRWTVVSDASDASHADAPECSSQRLRAQSAQSPPEAAEESEGVAASSRLPEAERPPPLLLHNDCSELRASTRNTCGASRPPGTATKRPHRHGFATRVMEFDFHFL